MNQLHSFHIKFHHCTTYINGSVSYCFTSHLSTRIVVVGCPKLSWLFFYWPNLDWIQLAIHAWQDNSQQMQRSSQMLNTSFNTVRLGSRCRSVFKTREFRLDYLTNMIDGSRKWVLNAGIFLQVEYWTRYRVLKILIKTHYDSLIKILIRITYCTLWPCCDTNLNINWATFWGRKMRPLATMQLRISSAEGLVRSLKGSFQP